MAEMRTLDCPSCEAANQPFAVADGVEEYRCRSCGLVYSGPCGCDTVHEDPVAEASDEVESLPSDWQMSKPATVVENGASTKKYPGCS